MAHFAVIFDILPKGLLSFLKLLEKEEIPRAIGTAAPPENVRFVLAGKNAGMKVIAITTAHTKRELSNADLIIDSFEELGMERLFELMK